MAAVDFLTTPPMFQLRDLMNDKVKGRYYAQNLVVAPIPKDDFFFEVEEILKTKTIKRVKYCFVKYLFYPKKVLKNKINSHCIFIPIIYH